MLSRDLLDAQELEYALSLIEDMEREGKEKEKESVGNDGNDEQDEQELGHNQDDDDEDRNPSPKTLRNMRCAYFERLALNKVAPLSKQVRAQSPPQPPQIYPHPQSHPQIQPVQIESTGRRLRSGRSY